MLKTFVVAITILSLADSTYVISVYGDMRKDGKFFTNIYPWVIDNIGGEIVVDYYLLGSGRYTVPQMCALNELRLNTFLQAQFLKCEAEGTPSESCLCETGIDMNKFRHCVLTKGSLASSASSKYSQLGIDASPVVEIGPKNTIFEVEASWYLKKICTIFGDNPPMGCVKPFMCNNTEIDYVNKNFNFLDCSKCNRMYTSTTTTTTGNPTTPTNESPLGLIRFT